MTPSTEAGDTSERADLLEALAKSRFFLCLTARKLSDEQAARRTTASALCLGGLIKHVAATEQAWMDFVLGGPEALTGGAGWSAENREKEFSMQAGETLAGIVEWYEEVGRRTDDLVATLPDLGISHPLPEAPWFKPGARWTARRVLLHVIAETAQHAGHADIIRESLDGSKSMG